MSQEISIIGKNRSKIKYCFLFITHNAGGVLDEERRGGCERSLLMK